jgi:phosphatidylserine decarboxylase
MQIHKEGKKIIPVAFFFLAVIDATIYFTLRNYLIFYFLMAASLFVAILVVFFFPGSQSVKLKRTVNHVLAPADGNIVEILKIHEEGIF